jgi:hypothetical protein
LTSLFSPPPMIAFLSSSLLIDVRAEPARTGRFSLTL